MLVQPNSMKAWLLATRPKTLGATFCPILIGGALAIKAHHFSLPLFLTTLICSMLLQIMANLINDYGDFLKGSDTKDRLGPPRAMQNGWLSKKVMRLGIGIVFFASSILGLFLVYHGGPGVLIVGLLSIFFCFWYSIGPRPLSRLGFGEVFIWLFFGPLSVMGTYFIQTLEFSMEAFFASLSSGFLAVALLLTNNLRDIKEDTLHNKKTLAVRFGESCSRTLIQCCLCLACASPVVLFWIFNARWPVLLALGALIFPLLRLPIIEKSPPSKSYNLMLEAIGKSLYIFGILCSLGIVLS